jgi:hypothetical protein
MYVSVTQLSESLGISTARVRKLASKGRFKGAFKIANVWIIPLVEGMPQATSGSRGPNPTWDKRRPSAISRIHVRQDIIRSNKSKNERKAVISHKQGETNDYGHEVVVHGPCRVIYQPDRPLKCGAKVWIETYSKVDVISFLF